MAILNQLGGMMDIVGLLSTIWAFCQSSEGTAILLAIVALEQALAKISWIEANSTFQLLYNITAKLAGKRMTVCLCLFVLAACSHKPDAAKVQQVVMTLKADGKTVVVTGCKDLPAVEVLASVAPIVYPPSAAAVTVGEKYAEEFCKAVLAAQKA